MTRTRSWRVIQGDCQEVLRTLPGESVQTCVTSPPYFGLRSYNGGVAEFGREDTPEAYVERLVGVFREVRRVLRGDGTVWLNLGDSYASQGGSHGGRSDNQVNVGARRVFDADAGDTGVRRPPAQLKPKDLIGIPWRVAFALQADGWWLRCDVVWAKPNPMPESVRDRPTRAHEYIFLLTKSKKYFYDAAAIRTQSKTRDCAAANLKEPSAARSTDKQRGHSRKHAGFNERWDGLSRDEQMAMGANKRSVWTVAPQNYPEAHFATFPEALIEPCILAGSATGDTVIDPFAGSGTTIANAVRNGRHAIGIELNSDYCSLIEKRLAVL